MTLSAVLSPSSSMIAPSLRPSKRTSSVMSSLANVAMSILSLPLGSQEHCHVGVKKSLHGPG